MLRTKASRSRRSRRGAPKPAEIEVWSPDMPSGEPMPLRFTAYGSNRSPALSWSGLPASTVSIVVVCVDLDGPCSEPYCHWLLFNVAATRSGLPTGIPPGPVPKDLGSAVQGVNDFGHAAYDGPSPLPGHPRHQYEFQVFALDGMLALPQNSTLASVRAAMRGCIVGEGRLLGSYSR